MLLENRQISRYAPKLTPGIHLTIGTILATIGQYFALGSIIQTFYFAAFFWWVIVLSLIFLMAILSMQKWKLPKYPNWILGVVYILIFANIFADSVKLPDLSLSHNFQHVQETPFDFFRNFIHSVLLLAGGGLLYDMIRFLAAIFRGFLFRRDQDQTTRQ